MINNNICHIAFKSCRKIYFMILKISMIKQSFSLANNKLRPHSYKSFQQNNILISQDNKLWLQYMSEA